MVRFVLFTMVFSALVPLIYLGWLWMTGKKWPEAAFEPRAEDRSLPAAAHGRP
jgi:hypothetical protein